jgi:hypothetical protein
MGKSRRGAKFLIMDARARYDMDRAVCFEVMEGPNDRAALRGWVDHDAVVVRWPKTGSNEVLSTVEEYLAGLGRA